MTARKIITLAVGVPLLLTALGIGGYIGYEKLMYQEEKNKEDLAEFGMTILPNPPELTRREKMEREMVYQKSTGVLGGNQQVATFVDEKLDPTQKVIRGLMNDKELLIEEQQVLKDEIAALEARIDELEEYKRLNEHFAPDNIDEQLAKVKAKLKQYLLNSPGAARFNNRQIEIVSAASATEFNKFIRHNRLILSEFQRDEIVNLYLPEFAFCLGDGIDVAANSPGEERLLVSFFEEGDITSLAPALRQDLDTVLKPCQTALHEKLAVYAPKEP